MANFLFYAFIFSAIIFAISIFLNCVGFKHTKVICSNGSCTKRIKANLHNVTPGGPNPLGIVLYEAHYVCPHCGKIGHEAILNNGWLK